LDKGVLLKLVSFGDDIVAQGSVEKLAKLLGFDFEDKSSFDICNQQIFRQVIEYTDNSEDVFLLIGWTHKQKLEINWKNETYTYKPDTVEYLDNGLNTLHRYDDIFFDDILLTQHWASNALTLQQTLSNLNINYYMYNTQDCMYYHSKTKNYIDSLCKRHYHNPVNLRSSMKYMKNWNNFLLGKIQAGGLL